MKWQMRKSIQYNPICGLRQGRQPPWEIQVMSHESFEQLWYEEVFLVYRTHVSTVSAAIVQASAAVGNQLPLNTEIYGGTRKHFHNTSMKGVVKLVYCCYGFTTQRPSYIVHALVKHMGPSWGHPVRFTRIVASIFWSHCYEGMHFHDFWLMRRHTTADHTSRTQAHLCKRTRKHRHVVGGGCGGRADVGCWDGGGGGGGIASVAARGVG